MRNIKLTISYDGTEYSGWQIQKNGRTIQGELERAVRKVFKKKHRVYGASRTDAGVHAKGQVAHFKTSSAIPVGRIAIALNSILPPNIAVIKAEESPKLFHARFDAAFKTYRYHIYNSRERDPFNERYSWRVPYRLNVPLMRKEGVSLLGRHNFKSFQAHDKIERNSICTIRKLTIRKKASSVTIDIEADGFAYNMVRNIAGTLVDIGRGYLAPGSMEKILEIKDRTKAGPTAPAKGLFLIKVKY